MSPVSFPVRRTIGALATAATLLSVAGAMAM